MRWTWGMPVTFILRHVYNHLQQLLQLGLLCLDLPLYLFRRLLHIGVLVRRSRRLVVGRPGPVPQLLRQESGAKGAGTGPVDAPAHR